jgi:hypothetical protein
VAVCEIHTLGECEGSIEAWNRRPLLSSLWNLMVGLLLFDLSCISEHIVHNWMTARIQVFIQIAILAINSSFRNLAFQCVFR